MNNEISFDTILEILLDSNLDISPSSTLGGENDITTYEIMPRDYLNDARKMLDTIPDNTLTKEKIIFELNRAMDEEIDIFINSMNISSKIKDKNLSAVQKLNFVKELGLISSTTIRKIIKIRNKLEHSYAKVKEDVDINAYYELIIESIRILQLFLELIINNEKISFKIKGASDDLDSLTISFDSKHVQLTYELNYKNKSIKKEYIDVFSDKADSEHFINAFKLYLVMMRYNINLDFRQMIENVKKIRKNEDFLV